MVIHKQRAQNSLENPESAIGTENEGKPSELLARCEREIVETNFNESKPNPIPKPKRIKTEMHSNQSLLKFPKVRSCQKKFPKGTSFFPTWQTQFSPFLFRKNFKRLNRLLLFQMITCQVHLEFAKIPQPTFGTTIGCIRREHPLCKWPVISVQTLLPHACGIGPVPDANVAALSLATYPPPERRPYDQGL